MKSVLLYIILVAILVSIGCKKFVTVGNPPDQTLSDFVFMTDATATKAVTGIYIQMMTASESFASGGISLYSGLSADELTYYTASARDEFLKNEIGKVGENTISANFWKPAYNFIYSSNLCLEKLETAASLSPAVKKQLKGEALFIRGFTYFNLVNLFGRVPLITSSDYRINAVKARTSEEEVYKQIEADLLEAENLLSDNYTDLSGLNNRTRANRFAATALLARMYLYRKNWIEAEKKASAVIASTTYALATNPIDVFLKTGKESIWQLQNVVTTINTWDGLLIIPASAAAFPTYVMRDTLINSFEAGDKRFVAWTAGRVYNSVPIRYPFKYQVRQGTVSKEFYTVLRLAEQFLIRAEARAQQGLLQPAKDDINMIRTRAGLANTAASSQSQILDAVLKERRVELFSEWGHRWFDLKRLDKAHGILSVLKPAWQSTDVLWPIPTDQLLLNPSLIQNPGY
ncbi:MAG: RagB/SusD family nutrient uptake outer membrane protein [Gemmatimonadaceae bacterium]|nr:RagB/SusD family nutrient uptake outer membrane protein [Chitinophagaceae bacterium]